jgi:hypothetical protein
MAGIGDVFEPIAFTMIMTNYMGIFIIIALILAVLCAVFHWNKILGAGAIICGFIALGIYIYMDMTLSSWEANILGMAWRLG